MPPRTHAHSGATRFPAYLWIIGVYPILHLYEANFGLVRDGEVAGALALMLAASTLAYALTSRLEPSPHIRALSLSIFSLVFSLSGHLYVAFIYPRSLVAWTLACVVLAGLAAFALRKCLPKSGGAQITQTLNLICAVLVALPLMSLARAAIEHSQFQDARLALFQTSIPAAAKVLDSPTRPDIYFIIPDGYSSDEVILSALDFDNSAFTNALRERGFVIVTHTHANYNRTYLSLASILNMRYYDSNPSAFSHADYLRLAAANSEVARQLLQLGYTYIHYLSGYVFPSPIADINRDFGREGALDIQIGAITSRSHARQTQDGALHREDMNLRRSFARLYLDTSLLRGFRPFLEDWLPVGDYAILHRKSPERFLDTLADLQAIAALPEATFAIAHLMQPHIPVNFNEQGETITQLANPGRDEIVADLQGSNLHFLRAIDGILQTSRHPPVIIFQADHGLGNAIDRYDTQSQHAAYAAYFLPEDTQPSFPHPYTLVNSFPLILNATLGLDLPLRADRLFMLPEVSYSPFAQTDETDAFLRSQEQGPTTGDTQ